MLTSTIEYIEFIFQVKMLHKADNFISIMAYQ